MTTELWEYRPGSHHAADLSLVGYEVEATDGPLGRVELDAGDHLLVDTRPWVPGAPVLVPVGLVARIDHLELVVHLDCPRARVRSAPPPAAVDRAAPGPAGHGLSPAGRAVLDAHYARPAAARGPAGTGARRAG
ncbi:hypothetical protein ABT093_24590 [Kitasatospora sp. NPDC002551]|uniref:hypothetical protein n=1 Tax=Kitasatospora sp. NPDC002551 TaxID=3154539 RepID=UPI003327108A